MAHITHFFENHSGIRKKKSGHQTRYKIAFVVVRTNASILTSREKKEDEQRRTDSIVKRGVRERKKTRNYY